LNIEKNNQLENYKIEHNAIKNLSTRRLKEHLDYVKELKRDFDVYEYIDRAIFVSSEDKKELYLSIKRYAFFIFQELKSRADYNDVLNDILEKRKNKKNKGCQHLNKQKKKKQKLG
jgi:hypothetical protein